MDPRLESLLRDLDEIGSFRWLAPWAGYVLALLIGPVVAGRSVFEIDAATFGIPLAWLAAWANARSERWGPLAVVALVLLGLIIGFVLS